MGMSGRGSAANGTLKTADKEEPVMIGKAIKYGGMTVLGLGFVGGLTFGGDWMSYVSSSAGSVRTAVKNAVPIEFELQRARDMAEQIVPELKANILLIAQEEVEIASLEEDIRRSEEAIDGQKVGVEKIRSALGSAKVSFVFADRRYSRVELAEDLSRRFERCKEGEDLLKGKRRLLETRLGSLHGAKVMLEKTRDQKAMLEQQIEGLAAQHRLVQAASVGSNFELDSTKLGQTQKILAEVRKRLDVAERVMSHESSYVETIPVNVLDEGELMAEVDRYLGKSKQVEEEAVVIEGLADLE